nr:MAG TPA: hypothetical protein [Caudoviricetes sp.]
MQYRESFLPSAYKRNIRRNRTPSERKNFFSLLPFGDEECVLTKDFELFLSNFLREFHNADSGQFRKNLINFFPSLSFGDGGAVLTKVSEKILI